MQYVGIPQSLCCYFLRTFCGAEHVRKQLNHITVSYLYIQYFNTAGMFQYVLLLEFPNYFVHRILPAFSYHLPAASTKLHGCRIETFTRQHSKKTYRERRAAAGADKWSNRQGYELPVFLSQRHSGAYISISINRRATVQWSAVQCSQWLLLFKTATKILKQVKQGYCSNWTISCHDDNAKTKSNELCNSIVREEILPTTCSETFQTQKRH